MSKIDPNGTLREYIKRARQAGLAPDDIDIKTRLPKKPKGMPWDKWLAEEVSFQEFSVYLDNYIDEIAGGLDVIEDEDNEPQDG